MRYRILFTLPNFKTAGSQYVLKSIASGLNTSEFEAFVSVESYPELIPEDIPLTHRLQQQHTNSVKKDARYFSNLLKKNNIHLVHSWDYKSNFYEALGCRLARVPYVYTKKNASWSKRWLLKSILAKKIAYDNPSMRQRFFSGWFLKFKIQFIPHGVDIKHFNPLKDLQKTSNFSLCCVGNINANKNQRFLIEILYHLPKEIELYLYGKAEPTYLKLLKNRVKELQLINRVHFESFVNHSKLPEVINKHWVLALTSYKEGLPVSVLEGLACGLPVLCSDSGGGTQYIFDKQMGGRCLPIDDKNAAINYLMSLYTDKKKYKETSMEARELARTHFSLDKEIDAYEQLYLKMLPS